MSTAAACLLYWAKQAKPVDAFDALYCAECARHWAAKILAGDE